MVSWRLGRNVDTKIKRYSKETQTGAEMNSVGGLSLVIALSFLGINITLIGIRKELNDIVILLNHLELKKKGE